MEFIKLLILSILATIILHTFLCYTVKNFSILHKFLVAGLMVGSIYTYYLFTSLGFNITFIAGILGFALFCELYIFTFSMVMTSISASIILRISKESTPVNILQQDYSGYEMVKNRFQRLQDSQLLVKRDKEYLVTDKAHKLLSIPVINESACIL